MNTPRQYPERYQFSLSNFLSHPIGTARLILYKIHYVLSEYVRLCKTRTRSVLRALKWLILRRQLPPSSADSRCKRTVSASKREYDSLKDREHILYDTDALVKVDCCGVLTPVGFRDLRDYKSEIIASRSPEPYGLFLDFGSGNGFNAKALSVRFPNAHIIGIDISRSRIEYAKRWVGHSDNIEFIQMNGAYLAFPDNYFDFVYSCHALEQMESIIDEAVSEIVRVMKHRAVLIEPVLENASLAQRLYLKKWGYVQSLLRVVQKQQNVRIVESFSLGIQGNPLNQSSLIVLEKIG